MQITSPYALWTVSEDDPSTIVALSSSSKDPADLHPRAIALTIVWHPDVRRVGQVAPLGTTGTLDVTRKTPPFEAGTDVFLSRAPFLEVRPRAGGAEVSRTTSSTAVDVEGRPLVEPLHLSEDDLRNGAILTLGSSVVVCLHHKKLPALRGASLGIVGGGDAIEAVRRQISKVADLDVSVLIRGETGTGKDLVARAINDASKRAVRSLVSVNMAAVPETIAVDELFGHEKGAFTGAAEARPGYFAQADGGTLFLDEIGATPADIQKMLLRVLETGEIRPLGARRGRKVDVRVLAATDEDLEAAARSGRFAEPLLHRLAGFQIRLPPIRERREDIGPLFLHFLRLELGSIGELDRLDLRAPPEGPWLEAAKVACIAASPLTGNVRALRNIARQLVVNSRGQRFAEIDTTIEHMLTAPDEMPDARDAAAFSAHPVKVTDKEIQAALQQHNYNFAAAADALGIHRSTLYDRVRGNPQGVRGASDLSDAEILACHHRHQGDVAAMAAELRVSPKPLKARLTKALARRVGS